MKRSTGIQIGIHIFVVFLILFIAALPLISVIIAGTIADANGCQLDEGGVHACVVNGADMGETLYTMTVMGWLMLATIPIGLGVAAVYVLAVAAFYITRSILRKRREAKAQLESGPPQ
jgi:hypothetical protein